MDLQPKSAVKCCHCERVLFLTEDGVLPKHKVPVRTTEDRRYRSATVPLTPRSAKWCPGSEQR